MFSFFLMNVQYLVELSDHRPELKNWHSSFNTPIYRTRLQKDFLILPIESNNILLIHEISSHATIHTSMAPNSHFYLIPKYYGLFNRRQKRIIHILC
jgi:hypothetical protein